MKRKTFFKSLSLALTVLLLFCVAAPAVVAVENTSAQVQDPLQQIS